MKENEIKEAERTLTKLNQDIVELESKRSNITNEIQARIEVEKRKLDESHKARMKQLEFEADKKKAEQDKQKKYLDDYMVRLDNQAQEQSNKQIILDNRETALQSGEENLEAQQAELKKQTHDEMRTNQKERDLISEEWQRLKVFERKLLGKESELNGKEDSFENREAIVASREKANNGILAEADKKLKETSEKEESIKYESNIIRENLDAIQNEKREIIKLSTIKDDIVKFEIEKEDLARERKKIQDWSDKTTIRERNVGEREVTATERERYLTLREREVQSKVDILRKLREGERA